MERYITEHLDIEVLSELHSELHVEVRGYLGFRVVGSWLWGDEREDDVRRSQVLVAHSVFYVIVILRLLGVSEGLIVEVS